MPEIAPSILSAEYRKIFEVLRELEMKADLIHIDVMDDQFVPNNTLDRFNPEFVAKLKNFYFTKNVHLMVKEHLKWCEAFAKAGADQIAFHFETGRTREGIELLKDNKVKAGVSIKPATQPEALTPFLGDLDFVLVMSVEPGFAGQEFLPSALPKIKWLKENFAEPYGGKVWVDGGIKKGIARQCAEAGADVLIAASAVFNSKQPDFLKNLKELQDEVEEA